MTERINENSPDLWLSVLPQKTGDQHKYDYGHVLIYGALELTGATTLAASACARIGAGLVTVIAPQDTGSLYRTLLPPHILVREDPAYDDPRMTARLYGPGGLAVTPDYKSPCPLILDADALRDLPAQLPAETVLTPHEGEFARAFPNLTGSRTERAQAAAKATGAIIVLKGSETLIADPDGHATLNRHASPHLATAGSGDVLAGLIAGLIGRGMPPYEAACAAVWIHGDCSLRFGPGLVAADLPDLIPESLAALSV